MLGKVEVGWNFGHRVRFMSIGMTILREWSRSKNWLAKTDFRTMRMS